MTGKLNHQSLLLIGLCISVFLTASLLIVDGQPYYNPYPYSDSQTAFEQAGIARAYQDLYNSEYNPYQNDPQAALDLMDIARANQMLYNYDYSDWEYWANLWLNAPYY